MRTPKLGNLFPDLRKARPRKSGDKWELVWFDAEPHTWLTDDWDQLGRVLHRLTSSGFEVAVRKCQ